MAAVIPVTYAVVPDKAPPAPVISIKTPISELKELSVKLGATPIYEQLDADVGPVHPRSYTFKVVLGEYSAVGTGTSKKKARHAGAQGVLDQIPYRGIKVHKSETNSIYSSSISDDRVDLSLSHFPGSLDNPIGDLEWRTHRLWQPPPTYEFTFNPGPPHTRVYTCTARLLTHMTTDSARSRKTAKRKAAESLLRLFKQDQLEGEGMEGGGAIDCQSSRSQYDTALGNGTTAITNNEDKNDIDCLASAVEATVLHDTHGAALDTRSTALDTHSAAHDIHSAAHDTLSEAQNAHNVASPHKDKVLKTKHRTLNTEVIEPYRTPSLCAVNHATVTAQKRCLYRALAVPGVWDGLVKKAQLISELNSTDSSFSPSINYCAILASVVDVKYLNIAERSLSGKHQCLVLLCTMPTIICHGSGNTDEESRSNGAHVALAYLKIFTEQLKLSCLAV